MAKYRVWQLRSGEGAILTRWSHLGLGELPQALPELFDGRILLVAGEDLPASGPEGGEDLGEGLWALRGEAARAFVADSDPLSRRALIWALVDELPEADARTRCIPEALRPWDHERLGAVAYAQCGKRYEHRGLWFQDPEDRRRWHEQAVRRILEPAGLSLPSGDVSLVLEMPGDATFEAELVAKGSGDSFRLRRDFGNQGFEREWWVERGEWKGEQTRRPRRGSAPLRQRAVQAIASTGIFLISLPVSLFVFLVLLTTKLTDVSTTSRKLDEGR